MERTPGFHRKAPTEELKTMFYSFMKQTLSCVQISSFHCLWYLREEQTAGSSLDASTEDLFYFSQEIISLFVRERTRQYFHISDF